MAPTTHVLDPDYDTVIVLKEPSIKFAGVVDSLSEGSCEVHYLVSSRHLQLASPWFKRAMTNDAWVESKSENGQYQVIAHDWDEDTFLMLLNLFHLRTKQVPRVVSLESLAKVGVLVDYYECGEALEMFTAMWIAELKKDAIPSTYCRDLILWVWVAWIFNLPECFEYASIVAIKDGKLAMDTLELPIPASISNLRRYQAIGMIVSGLHELFDNYRSDTYVCPQNSTLSDLCGSFMLGSLTRQLNRWSLLSPRPEIPFHDTSFSKICGQARNTKSLEWQNIINNSGYNHGYSSYYNSSQHSCSLTREVKIVVDRVCSGIKGLSLKDIQDSKRRGAEGSQNGAASDGQPTFENGSRSPHPDSNVHSATTGGLKRGNSDLASPSSLMSVRRSSRRRLSTFQSGLVSRF